MGTATQLAPAADAEYLKLIQSVISRLAQNSFQAKSWSVAIVTGILAFTSRSAQAASCALALFPAFCFWVLDAYYLRQERLAQWAEEAADIRAEFDDDAEITLIETVSKVLAAGAAAAGVIAFGALAARAFASSKPQPPPAPASHSTSFTPRSPWGSTDDYGRG